MDFDKILTKEGLRIGFSYTCTRNYIEQLMTAAYNQALEDFKGKSKLGYVDNDINAVVLVEDIESQPVRVIWCKCGKSIYHAGKPEINDKDTRKEVLEAISNGQKVETITWLQYSKLDFNYCECLNQPPTKQ